jgi:low temperature requirement protein LtrA
MSGQQVEREQRVTPLELFFDLVVVLHYREDRIEVRQARP